jgi:hypothetical protein
MRAIVKVRAIAVCTAFWGVAIAQSGWAQQPATPTQSATPAQPGSAAPMPDMNGMGMSDFMVHCEQMKEKMQPGVAISADMHRCINMFMPSGKRPR